MDAMEPWSPSTNFYCFTMGLWVKFTGPINSGQLEHCGYITAVEGGLVTIVDKHMFAEVSNKLSSAELANIRPKFNIDRAELEVTASQGPSIPAGDKVYLLWVDGPSLLWDLTEPTKVLSKKLETPQLPSNSKPSSHPLSCHTNHFL